MHRKLIYIGLIIIFLIICLIITNKIDNFVDRESTTTTQIYNTLPLLTEIPTIKLLPQTYQPTTIPKIYQQSSNQNIPIITDTTTIPHNSQLYTKFDETFIEENDLNTDILYKKYNGNKKDGNDDDKVWTNVNLDQCYDKCNNLDYCIGFSRPLKIADNESSNCYPRTSINVCHSSHKGNKDQRTNAIKYNSYIKNNSNTNNNNMKTRCIGNKTTFNQIIVFKSELYPSKYIAINNNEIKLMEIPENGVNMMEFYAACRFEIINGLDGSGTITIKHIDTNKILYRLDDNILDTRDIAELNTIENKQKASFYLNDGIKNGNIRLKCYILGTETIPKFITINPNNSSRLLLNIENNNTSYTQDFEILDIINGNPVNIMNTNPNLINKFVDISDDEINLDRIKTMLYGSSSEAEFKNYIDENYPSSYKNVNKNVENIQKKIQNINTGINSNTYDINTKLKNLEDTNNELEDALNTSKNKITKSYNNIYNKISKMHLDDYLNNYYYLTNLVKK